MFFTFFWDAHRAPPYDAYTHIYFYGCRWYCVLRDWKQKKRNVRCFVCPLAKIHHQHLQVLLIYFNYHSIRDYSSIHVFSFCFFQFAPTLCGLFTIFYIWLNFSSRPRRIYNFDLSWWRLHFQPLAGGEKRPAAHSIILRHPPKANPRLTLSLCNFVRPPSAFYQVITLPWSKKPFDSM